MTRTAARAVRAVLADWMALSRSIISSRRASRSPSARICAGAGRASSSRAARTASIGSLLPARRLPDVTAAVDLGDLLTLPGQVAGQAQPVVPGAFHRPDDLRRPPAANRTQASSCAYPAVVAGICSCEITRPRASQIAAVWVSRWVSYAHDQVRLSDFAHGGLLLRCDAGKAAPAWRETPAAIL